MLLLSSSAYTSPLKDRGLSQLFMGKINPYTMQHWINESWWDVELQGYNSVTSSQSYTLLGEQAAQYESRQALQPVGDLIPCSIRL